MVTDNRYPSPAHELYMLGWCLVCTANRDDWHWEKRHRFLRTTAIQGDARWQEDLTKAERMSGAKLDAMPAYWRGRDMTVENHAFKR